MKNALTPELWREIVAGTVHEIDDYLFSSDRNADPYVCEPLDYHAQAAYRLHGQPFGFTHEDVSNLMAAAGVVMLDEAGGDPDNVDFGNIPDDASALLDLLRRIEALLPPKE